MTPQTKNLLEALAGAGTVAPREQAIVCLTYEKDADHAEAIIEDELRNIAEMLDTESATEWAAELLSHVVDVMNGHAWVHPAPGRDAATATGMYDYD
jgi:hypothetical protein